MWDKKIVWKCLCMRPLLNDNDNINMHPICLVSTGISLSLHTTQPLLFIAVNTRELPYHAILV